VGLDFGKNKRGRALGPDLEKSGKRGYFSLFTGVWGREKGRKEGVLK